MWLKNFIIRVIVTAIILVFFYLVFKYELGIVLFNCLFIGELCAAIKEFYENKDK